jgi:hypothetical protein
MLCKVCERRTHGFAKAEILHKYVIQYFRCSECGFIQTEEPYWLEEAYSDAIISTDIGLVRRHMKIAKSTQAIISAFFHGNAPYLDYGGGYGLFVRMMRDMGYDFFRFDPYCENLFAKGWDTRLAASPSYELVTAFEVFEHLAEPREGLAKMSRFSRNILFSTELVPVHAPKPGTWWYYALEGGQHVSLHTTRSLQILAARSGLNFVSDGKSLHLMTDLELPKHFFRLAMKRPVAGVLNRIYRRKSLLGSDYQRLTGHAI